MFPSKIISMHAVIKEAEENLVIESLPLERQKRLKLVGDGCCTVLLEMQGVLIGVDDWATNSTAIEAIQTLLEFYATCQLAVMKPFRVYVSC